MRSAGRADASRAASGHAKFAASGPACACELTGTVTEVYIPADLPRLPDSAASQRTAPASHRGPRDRPARDAQARHTPTRRDPVLTHRPDPRHADAGAQSLRESGARVRLTVGRRPAARSRHGCRSGSSQATAWPSISCTLRRSAPPSSRWVAAVCRRPCGPGVGHRRGRRRSSCTTRRAVRGSRRPPRAPRKRAGPLRAQASTGRPWRASRRPPGPQAVPRARRAPCRPSRAP